MSEQPAGSAIIECKIKRPGGSTISMGDGTEYLFSPDNLGRHVAVIDSMAHITRFMQIPDYTVLQLIASTAPAPASVPAQATPIVATVSKEVGGTSLDQTQTLQSEDVGTGSQEGAKTADDVETSLTLPQPGEDGAYSADAETTIRGIFKIELGRVAPPKSKPETMVAQILAAREARSA